ncbi:hypothetical protein V5O48_013502 [Marasmius crinis-equi]|uniref:Protein kinase domain-containing protein n=1 Tax=Marasmius crinis-equi TaxID=585013 RepID=A0ABR3EZW6_9AGAR
MSISSQGPAFNNIKELLEHLEVHKHAVDQAMNIVNSKMAPSVMEMIQLHLDSSDDHPLRRTCIQCLLLLNRRYGSLPSSIYLSDIEREGSHAIAGGGYGDIWMGHFADEEKQKVCLKVLRVYLGSYNEKKLLKQVGDEQRAIPTKLLHRVTWMANGDVISYCRGFSLKRKVNMMQEVAAGIRYLHDHSPPIVHSDIKGANILVSDDGHPRITDFGLSTIEDPDEYDHRQQSTNSSSSQAVIRGSVPWLAPELMNPEHVETPNRTTRDMYAFGCTMYEIFAGNRPFHEKKMDMHIMLAVLSGSRPSRLSCPYGLWTVIEECWTEDAETRLSAGEVALRLDEMDRVMVSRRRVTIASSTASDDSYRDSDSVFEESKCDACREGKKKLRMLQVEERTHASLWGDGLGLELVARDYIQHGRANTWPLPNRTLSSDVKGFLEHLDAHRHTIDQAMRFVRPDTAPSVMEMIQVIAKKASQTPLRKTCFQCLFHLNKRHGSIPASIHLPDVTREGAHPLTCGGYADIWKGRLADKHMVCLKVLRVYTGSFDEGKLRRQLGDEVLIWRQLRHPNIHRFLGITDELFQPSYCIVSPWMSNGDVMHYMRERKVSLEGKLKMMQEISEAIQYLHEHHPPIIHSDIKGMNILASDDGHCLLNDFGLAAIEGDLSEGHIDPAVVRGSVPWLAPELMNPDPADSYVPNRTTGDIYALGCTIFELLTGTTPFSEKKREPQIIVAVLHGFRPERPRDQATCPDRLWEIIEGCWKEDARKRFGASEVVVRLREMMQQEGELVPVPASSDILRRPERIKNHMKRELSQLKAESDSRVSAQVTPPKHQEQAPAKQRPKISLKLDMLTAPSSPEPTYGSINVCHTINSWSFPQSQIQSPDTFLGEALDWFFEEEEELSRLWDAWFLRDAWDRYQGRVG